MTTTIMELVAEMTRKAKPVEPGKYGRLHPVARFLNIPAADATALKNLGLVRLRNGRTTPEDLKADYDAHAWQLEKKGQATARASVRALVLPVPDPRLMTRAGRKGGTCAPVRYRPPAQGQSL